MRVHPVDFLRPQRAPPMGWVLLVFGVALMGTVLAWRAQVVQEQQQRLAREQVQRETQRRALEAALRRAVPTLQDKRLNGVRDQLQLPWVRTLRAVEGSTEPPVYLTQLMLDPASGTVQIEAEAPTFADALNYVQRLSDPGALVSPRLVSHEQSADPIGGGSKLKFALIARWAAR